MVSWGLSMTLPQGSLILNVRTTQDLNTIIINPWVGCQKAIRIPWVAFWGFTLIGA